jgi:hypothetical protein
VLTGLFILFPASTCTGKPVLWAKSGHPGAGKPAP